MTGQNGEKDSPDAEREAFVALYFRTERFVRGLTALASEDSPLFRVLTTNAGRRHAVRHVKTPEPDRALMIDLYANAAVAYAERRDGWEQVVEALGIAVTTAISPVMPEEEPQDADDALAVILAKIAAHPESVSLADLAARYSYSAPHLSELIHERGGRTFTEPVREQRMERAAMLLRATGLPVAEVARRVGYAGTSNFHRAFRERYGRSPAELRAEGR